MHIKKILLKIFMFLFVFSLIIASGNIIVSAEDDALKIIKSVSFSFGVKDNAGRAVYNDSDFRYKFELDDDKKDFERKIRKEFSFIGIRLKVPNKYLNGKLVTNLYLDDRIKPEKLNMIQRKEKKYYEWTLDNDDIENLNEADKIRMVFEYNGEDLGYTFIFSRAGNDGSDEPFPTDEEMDTPTDTTETELKDKIELTALNGVHILEKEEVEISSVYDEKREAYYFDINDFVSENPNESIEMRLIPKLNNTELTMKIYETKEEQKSDEEGYYELKINNEYLLIFFKGMKQEEETKFILFTDDNADLYKVIVTYIKDDGTEEDLDVIKYDKDESIVGLDYKVMEDYTKIRIHVVTAHPHAKVKINGEEKDIIEYMISQETEEVKIVIESKSKQKANYYLILNPVENLGVQGRFGDSEKRNLPDAFYDPIFIGILAVFVLIFTIIGIVLGKRVIKSR